MTPSAALCGRSCTVTTRHHLIPSNRLRALVTLQDVPPCKLFHCLRLVIFIAGAFIIYKAVYIHSCIIHNTVSEPARSFPMTTLLSFKNKQVLQLFRSSLSFLLCVQFLHFKLLLPYHDFLRNFRLYSHDTTTVRLSFSINDTKFQHIYFPFYTIHYLKTPILTWISL